MRQIEPAAAVRHFGLLLALVAAYLLREALPVDNRVLWVIGFAALANVLLFAGSRRQFLAPACGRAAPLVALVSWGALIHFTGGAGSPFIAGLWLELLLTMAQPSVAMIPLITASAIAVLGVQEFLFQTVKLTQLGLHVGFLMAAGLLITLVSVRIRRERNNLSRQYLGLDKTLQQLEAELDAQRAVGIIGEKTARLAHGVKNGVHSMRGLVALLGPRVRQQPDGAPILTALCETIAQIEELMRITLSDQPAGGAQVAKSDTFHTLKRTVARFARSHSRIRCRLNPAQDLPRVTLTPQSLDEVLTVLLSNSSEAMDDQGEIRVHTRQTDGSLYIDVWDRGPGLSREALEHLFVPSRTTKANGNGYGLFLARRLVRRHGGDLSVEPNRAVGTQFTIRLPVEEVIR